MKWLNKVALPKKVTVTTITYIPDLSGYWEETLDVLALCLESARRNTNVEFDLMLLDNGSCAEVISYLQRLKMQGLIQYLILTDRNIGKVGGWNILFAAAPGDIVSYFDSDVYFYHDWLRESLRIIEEYPEAGMVTAQPIAGEDLTASWTAQAAIADSSVLVNTGCLIPDEYVKATLAGISADEKERMRREKNRNDALLSRNGVEAYATASHFQFTTTKDVLSGLFPADTSIPLGDDLQFDREMKELGYWRLSTKNYLVHHMGNRVPDFNEEVPFYRDHPYSGEQNSLGDRRKSHYKQITSIRIRRMLKAINTWSYRLLYRH